MRHIGQYPMMSHDPRYPFRHHNTEPVMRHPPSQYSPPRVRSGRGSLRLTTMNRGPSPATTHGGVARASFPVSNRGKGRPSVNRPVILSSESTMNSDRRSPDAAIAAAAEETGKSVQRVAVAISRKTKRKLPLARKTSSDADEGTSAKME